MPEMMLKILHVVSDDKFIDLLLPRYFRDEYENEIVYLKKEFTYKGKYLNIMKWVMPFTKKFEDVFNEPTKFNIVIVYSINNSKALFINSIPKKPIIIWHFFGTEIYNQTALSKYNYSQATKKIVTVNTKAILKEKVQNALLFFGRMFNSNYMPQTEINRAILSIDYFMWYNKDEYDYLKSQVLTLPEFLQLPITTIYPEPDSSVKDKTKILLGNSSTPQNNHLDILLLLQKLQYTGEVVVPFGYGDLEYKEKLLQIIKGMTLDINVLEDFMLYTDYLNLLGTVRTAVFNSYRQMGLGNIFILLFYGTKVYISEKNPTYPWLNKLGFHIYSIEADLEKELKSGDLQLDAAQMLHNRALYNQMADVSRLDSFIEQLPTLVKTRKP